MSKLLGIILLLIALLLFTSLILQATTYFNVFAQLMTLGAFRKYSNESILVILILKTVHMMTLIFTLIGGIRLIRSKSN